MVFEVAPRSASERPMVLVLKVTLPNRAEKTPELVRQTKTLKVYVNPDPLGYDEWDIGSQVFQIMTGPRPSGDQNVLDSMAGAAAIASANYREAYWAEI